MLFFSTLVVILPVIKFSDLFAMFLRALRNPHRNRTWHRHVTGKSKHWSTQVPWHTVM